MKIRDVVQSVCLTAAVASLSACGSNTAPVPPSPPDVYAVGFETDGNLFKAVLWKNDVLTVLDSGNYGARAEGIAVANGHVYVAGFEGSASGNNAAVLWTDGVPTLLTDSSGTAIASIASAVAVSGTDVYVVGYETLANYSAAPVYWENGSPTALTNGLGTPTAIFTPTATASSIAVDGSTIYIAGNVATQTETAPNTYTNEPAVTYWENGTATSVTNGSEFAQTYGIAAQNGHVYVAGSLCATFAPDCSVATLWTDGVAASLTPNLLSAASGVTVSGSNVYASVNVTDAPGSVLAASGTTAELWTNGTLKPLSATNQSAANCVTTYGTDVYVGGAETNTSAYWLDGTLTYLTGVPTGNNNVAAVYAMAVVPSS